MTGYTHSASELQPGPVCSYWAPLIWHTPNMVGKAVYHTSMEAAVEVDRPLYTSTPLALTTSSSGTYFKSVFKVSIKPEAWRKGQKADIATQGLLLHSGESDLGQIIKRDSPPTPP